MQQIKRVFYVLSCSALLSACGDIPASTFYDHGNPEHLIDVSVEMVEFKLASGESITELEDALAAEQPARARLHCAEDDQLCDQAMTLLDDQGITAEFKEDKNIEHSAITLMYERITARDCAQRYVDNSQNNYNLTYESMGCAATGNMVQMVTDKKQFTAPALMDHPDAAKAVQAYGHYLKPPSSGGQSLGDDSLLESISTD